MIAAGGLNDGAGVFARDSHLILLDSLIIAIDFVIWSNRKKTIDRFLFDELSTPFHYCMLGVKSSIHLDCLLAPLDLCINFVEFHLALPIWWIIVVGRIIEGDDNAITYQPGDNANCDPAPDSHFAPPAFIPAMKTDPIRVIPRKMMTTRAIVTIFSPLSIFWPKVGVGLVDVFLALA